MTHNHQPEIQLWQSFPGFSGGVEITQEGKNDLVVLNNGIVPELPEDLQERVESYPVNHDGDVLFLDTLKNFRLYDAPEDVGLGLAGNIKHPAKYGVLQGKFSRTNFFNRTEEGYQLTEELTEFRGLTASTHMILTAGDEKNPTILYGTKKNQFNQVSGFGGFPQVGMDFETDSQYIDLFSTVHGRLKGEITDELTDRITSINAIGLTYVNRPKLRGTDMNFHVHIDASPEEVQAKFEENSQFAKQLFAVPLDPEAMGAFYASVHEDGGHMSPYARGCGVQMVAAKFGGYDAAKGLMDTIREKTGSSIEFGIHNDYFG